MYGNAEEKEESVALRESDTSAAPMLPLLLILLRHFRVDTVVPTPLPPALDVIVVHRIRQ